jgi:hypothetical protein
MSGRGASTSSGALHRSVLRVREAPPADPLLARLWPQRGGWLGCPASSLAAQPYVRSSPQLSTSGTTGAPYMATSRWHKLGSSRVAAPPATRSELLRDMPNYGRGESSIADNAMPFDVQNCINLALVSLV